MRLGASRERTLAPTATLPTALATVVWVATKRGWPAHTANADVFREVRASHFPNRAALPASTLRQISRLANSAYLLEVEAIAILPPRA